MTMFLLLLAAVLSKLATIDADLVVSAVHKEENASKIDLKLNCCSLTREQLRSLKCGPDCAPFKDFGKSSRDRCEGCPSGMCRVLDRCLSGAQFLGSSFYQTRCKQSFGAIYPESIGKENREGRGCRIDAAAVAPPPSNRRCCTLSLTELESLQGWSSRCYFVGNSIYEPISDDKCALCPTGTCAMLTDFGYDCLCPETLMESFSGVGLSNDKTCMLEFGKPYPQTVGVEAPSLRYCNAKGRQNVTWSSISCCALPRETLLSMVGWHVNCPDPLSRWYRQQNLSRCEPCPPGQCRVGNNCICPDVFMGRDNLQAKCIDSFGEMWPESVGKVDEKWGNCRGLRVPKLVNGEVNDESIRVLHTTESLSIFATIVAGVMSIGSIYFLSSTSS